MEKSKLGFRKGQHVTVLESIARGLSLSGSLDTYVELGVQRGAAFNVIAPYAKKIAHAIDISSKSREYIRNNKNLKWFNGKTLDFLAQYNGPPVDFAFIDADHSHKASLADFKALLPLVRENGIIALHDTYPPSKEWTAMNRCGDTFRTAEYIRANMLNEVEIITLPFYFGVSIVRKGNKQLYW